MREGYPEGGVGPVRLTARQADQVEARLRQELGKIPEMTISFVREGVSGISLDLVDFSVEPQVRELVTGHRLSKSDKPRIPFDAAALIHRVIAEVRGQKV